MTWPVGTAVQSELDALHAECAALRAERDELIALRHQFAGENTRLFGLTASLRDERDSWKREAELNQQAADESAMYAARLATALELLRKHGIHVDEKWCWCEPRIESHREGGE